MDSQRLQPSAIMAAQPFGSDSELTLPTDVLDWESVTYPLEAFDELMDVTADMGPYSAANPAFDLSLPNLSPAPVARASCGRSKLDALESSHTLSSAENRLRTNRMSQKRVRERRKVLEHSHLANPLQLTSWVLQAVNIASV